MAAADTDKKDPADIKRKARRRLVGAIALVVFVVIALPLVLDRDPKPISQDLSVQIPGQDSGKFNNRVDQPAPAAEPPKLVEAPAAPAAEQAAPKMAVAPVVPPVSAGKAADAPAAPAPVAPAPAKAEPTKAQAAKAEPARLDPPASREPAREPAKQAPAKDAAKAGAAAPAVADGQGFMVPLGAYTNAANVRQQRAKAKAAGVESYAEALKTDKGEQTRVRAGPFATRDAAEKARERLIQAGVKPVGAVTAR